MQSLAPMKILFISANRLGDAVLSTGLLRHLGLAYPKAQISVAAGPLPARLLAAAPGVNRVIPLPKQRRGGHWLKLWQQVATTRWDLVIDLRNSPISYALMARQVIRHQPSDQPLHKVVELGRLLGLDPPPEPTLWFDIDTYREADNLVPPGAPILAVAPAASWTAKVWPPECFAKTIKSLTGPRGLLPGARVMIHGAEAEREMCQAAVTGIGKRRILDFIGTDPYLAAACLSRADLFIGNDSGLMHVAAAGGVPTLGLFGPSDERIYAPWGTLTATARTPESVEELHAHPDFSDSFNKSLMRSLSVDTVTAAATKLWHSALLSRPVAAAR